MGKFQEEPCFVFYHSFIILKIALGQSCTDDPVLLITDAVIGEVVSQLLCDKSQRNMKQGVEELNRLLTVSDMLVFG